MGSKEQIMRRIVSQVTSGCFMCGIGGDVPCSGEICTAGLVNRGFGSRAVVNRIASHT